MADHEPFPRRVDANRTGSAEARSGGYANSGVHIGSVHTYPQARSRYREQVRQIAPRELIGRDQELADLTGFCASDSVYTWWRATKWAGKSALMAWFVLHPPPGVQVVSFFVTGRLAGQDHRGAFVDVVLEQVAELLGEPPPTFLPDVTREHHLVGMLAEAAELCRGRGERLVLVVDGLDEDRGVVVDGRSHSIVHSLTTSPEARVIRDDMELELERLLNGTTVEQDLLGLLVAAAGGLTAGDFAELIESTPAAVRRILRAVAARSFETRPGQRDGQDVYLLGHEELQATALEEFGNARLRGYRERLHAWADGYRARDWPEDTPEYLLRGYFRLLTAVGDIDRMVGCATSASRHDRLLDLSGGDVDATSEIAACQKAILDKENPDVKAMARLAIHRDRLIGRNRNIPVELPALWAMLGQKSRAEALLGLFDDVPKQASASVSLARTLAQQGDLTAAGSVARSIILPGYQAEAMLTLIKPLARLGDSAAAEEIRLSMHTVSWKVQATVSIAEALLENGHADDADVYMNLAERDASSIREPNERVDAFLCVGRVLVAAGHLDRAAEVLQMITELHQGVHGRARMVEAAIAANQMDTAMDWARQISSADREAEKLAEIARAVAVSGDVVCARELIAEAGAVLEGKQDEDLQADTWCALAAAMVTAGDFEKADALAGSITSSDYRHQQVLVAAATAAAMTGETDRAHSMISKVTVRALRAGALVDIAKTLVDAGQPEKARAVAMEAERATRVDVDPATRVRSMISVVEAVEQAGDLRRAHELALRVAAIGEPNDRVLWNLARTGSIAKAVALIAVREDPEGRVRGLVNLRRRQVILENIDQVRMWIDQIEETEAKDSAKASVAKRAALFDLAESIEDDDQRTGTLISLATGDNASRVLDAITHPYWLSVALVRLAEFPDLIDMLAERLDQLPHVEWRARLVIAFARSLLADGQTRRASVFVDEAQAYVERIDSPYGRARTLAQIAELMTTPTQAVMARDLVRRAFAVAESVPRAGRRGEILARLVEISAAQGEFEQADEIAGAIDHSGWQARVNARLVKSLAERGQVGQAEEKAAVIDHPGWRAEALLALVTLHPDTDRAATIAGTIVNPDYQAEALVSLIVRDGRPALVQRLQEILPQVSSRNRRTRVIRDLAGALGEQAEGFALSITDPQDQVTAWRVVAHHRPDHAVARILHVRPWDEALDIVTPEVLDVFVAEVFAEQQP